MLTRERLCEVLKYDPETGAWIWLPRIGNAQFGGPAGSVCSGGYIQIVIDGVAYMAHRLAWLYMTGEWPSRRPDHKDTDPANNRWSNLRLATRSQNAANRKVHRNNSLGFKGVVLTLRKLKPYRATITCKGRRHSIGYFKTAAAANAAYEQRARELFGEFARAA